MSDGECDLDELTAFLEASDDDDDTAKSSAAENSDEKTKAELKQKGDECSLDDISAFLEESDDEDGEEGDKMDDIKSNSDVPLSTTDHASCGNLTSETNEGEDNQDAGTGLVTKDGPDDKTISAETENTPTIDDQKENSVLKDVDLCDNMDGFDDMDPDELNELEELEAQSQSFDNTETQSLEVSVSQSVRNSQSQSTEKVENQSDVAENQSTDVVDEKKENEVSETRALKAQMAAMAAQMAKMQEMLESRSSKSSSSPSSKHSKHSQDKNHKSPRHKDSDKHRHRSGSDKNSPSSSKLREKDRHSYNNSHRDSSKNRQSSKNKDNERHSSSDKRHSVNSSHKSSSNSHRHSPKSKSDSKDEDTIQKLKIEALRKEENKKRTPVSNQMYSQKKEGQREADDNPFFNKHSDASSQHNKKPAPLTSQSNIQTDDAPVDAKTLFGESDDSDWDELDGSEKYKLSEEGQEIKKLVTGGARKREAHTAKYDTQVLNKSPRSTWAGGNSTPKAMPPSATRPFPTTPFPSKAPQKPQKPALDPETGTVSGKYRVKDEYKSKPMTAPVEDMREVVTDPFCGIRIINPRISMQEFKNKMSGRNLLSVSRLLSKAGTSDLQKDNWVTMGVVVHKTEPRQSAVGKPYCIWKLSDLNMCEKNITFFLFGNVYKDHWKSELGVVIGLLNPTLMDKAEKAQSEVAITINHPQQLLMMGRSKDLGRCRGTTKSGQPCASIINKQQGEYCTYHVQAAYRKTSSKRTELQASTGVVPKAFQAQKMMKNNNGCFNYKGATFSTMKPQNKSSQDQVTLRKLAKIGTEKGAAKITTMSLHELEPEHELKLQKLQEKEKQLLELLSVPTAGSMNFVKHLVKKDTVTETEDGKEKLIVESASAKDLLKQHQTELQLERLATKRLAAVPKLGMGFGSGTEISLDEPVAKPKTNTATQFAKLLAIAKVKAKGGIEKSDPNAVRNKLTSPEARQKIKKRLADHSTESDSKQQKDPECSEPPRKKSKLLGDLDLNSPEVQKLLKSKSKHKGALAEAEAEHEERYFNSLEKRERMEDKMDATMEVSVSLAYCVQCKYSYYTVSDKCKQENHQIKRIKGVKRFFRCKKCKTRIEILDKIPNRACKNCGECNFERVSMLKDRKGPKLESEELCLRGNEQTFVGSIQGKTFING